MWHWRLLHTAVRGEPSTAVSRRWATQRYAAAACPAQLVLAVLYNAPKFAESRLEYRGDGVACAVHTALIDHRLYLIVYGNVLYTVLWQRIGYVVLMCR